MLHPLYMYMYMHVYVHYLPACPQQCSAVQEERRELARLRHNHALSKVKMEKVLYYTCTLCIVSPSTVFTIVHNVCHLIHTCIHAAGETGDAAAVEGSGERRSHSQAKGPRHNASAFC